MRVFPPFVAGIVLVAGSLFAEPTLKEAFERDFRIGAALSPKYFSGRDSAGVELVKKQFNTITPENALKWEPVHPRPDEYRFEEADRFVEFGEANDMFIVGHALVWHHQTPDWVFQDGEGKPLDREALLERMREHIHTVVGRYKGRVHGWDVVNEALADDGSLRDSPWKRIIGDDYVQKAFEYAHEADPDAELYYNDYSIEEPAKRAGTVALLKRLKEAGCRIDGVGIQEHVGLDWPSLENLEASIRAFGNEGVQVMITELDVNVLPTRWGEGDADLSGRKEVDPALNPYTEGLPDEMQEKLANRYAELFALYRKHRDLIPRVTFWGVGDGDSWLNNFPVRGRTNYPLLFDRDLKPKAAYQAVIEAASG